MREKPCVVLLGGCGNWGRRVLEELLRSQHFPRIIIGDIHIEEAKILATAVGSNLVGIEAQYVDADDSQSLFQVMKRGDVVVNLIAPYPKYCFKVVKAAIEAKVNYVDICECWQTTKHVFDELDGPAKEAKVTVLMGLGASPGMVNILARYGADQLDEVEEVHTAFISSLGISSPLEWSTRLRAISGEVPMYKDGEWINTNVHNNIETVHLLEPNIMAEIHPVDHSPIVTIPRFIRGTKVVACRGGYYPVETNRFIHTLVGFALTSNENITIDDASKPMVEFVGALCSQESVMRIMRGGKEPSERWSAYLVRVKGKQAGRLIELSYHFCNRREPNRTTTLPVTLGAQKLFHCDISQNGVLAPEALDPKYFINEMLKIGGVTLREVKEQVL